MTKPGLSLDHLTKGFLTIMLTPIQRLFRSIVLRLLTQGAQSVRTAYRVAPISTAWKLRVKQVTFRALSPLLKGTSSYQAWLDYQQRAAALGVDYTENSALQLHIDKIIHLPLEGLLLNGWIAEFSASLDLFSCTFGNDHALNIHARELAFYHRPDLACFFNAIGRVPRNSEVGFWAWIPTPTAIDLPHSVCKVTAHFRGGHRQLPSVAVCEPATDRLNLIQYLASCYVPDRKNLDAVIDKLGHAVSVLWRTREQHRPMAREFQFGKQPEAPSVSVIVPFFLPIECMRFQLSLFADDADWEDGELIFVLEEADLNEHFARWCDQLEPLFGLAFRVLVSSADIGYAQATNIAAEYARAQLLLLLHPDVLPTAKGWLKAMTSAYAVLPNIGALGVRLLEQGERSSGLHLLPQKTTSNEQLQTQKESMSGFGNHLGEHSGKHAVPTISGACLMVDRTLYFEIGGLDEDFLWGAFSDKDFCRRLGGLGKINYQLETLALYHLKQPTRYSLQNAHAWQFIIEYNRWLSDRRSTGSSDLSRGYSAGPQEGEWDAYPCN
ncbi:glycosyltransferase family 2 protein [Methylolobus aquaticus]